MSCAGKQLLLDLPESLIFAGLRCSYVRSLLEPSLFVHLLVVIYPVKLSNYLLQGHIPFAHTISSVTIRIDIPAMQHELFCATSKSSHQSIAHVNKLLTVFADCATRAHVLVYQGHYLGLGISYIL